MLMKNIGTLLSAVLLVHAKPSILQDIRHLQSSKSSLLQYPTQLTQGIIPKGIHSHNDYWREVPLFTAISFGVTSVEADVWLVDGELLVGHEVAALTKARTLDSLYIQPLLKMVDQQNPGGSLTNQTIPNGVFDTASDIPLQLLIDIKTDGEEAMPFVLRSLDPLRRKGYLTKFENGIIQRSAITVIGTGNTPLNDVLNLSPRDFFFDAPLTRLDSGFAENTSWSPGIAPIASTNYALAIGWNGINNITNAQLQILEKLVSAAHTLGIKARFWETPGWPIFARNHIWKQLITSGSDWLNVDDVEAASMF